MAGKRQIFSIARRASSYSLDQQTDKGLTFNFKIEEGTEALTYPGIRNDSNQFWRQYKMWEYQQGNLPEVGLLNDDQLNHYGLRNDPLKMRVRQGDKGVQQWLFRMQRAADYSASYDQMPHEEQPNYSADHHYITATQLPQVKAEYEEQHLVEMVTNQFDDMHHKLRNCGFFGITRFMQIQQQKSKAKSTVGVLNSEGQIERQETIAGSLARSAF